MLSKRMLNEFVMELPDDYEWSFIGVNNTFFGISPDKEPIMYVIENEKLVKYDMKLEPPK